MMRQLQINFPDLIEWNDYQNYDNYEIALLEVYERDLWKGGVKFNGLNVRPRVYKRFEFRGRILDWTFAHFTSKGHIEENREFDLRRCERIGWVKPIIENAKSDEIKVWENSRKDKKGRYIKSVVLWCEQANAKVVLTKTRTSKGEYYLITTFYLINNPNSIKSHKVEYDNYVKTYGEFVVI